MVHQHSTGASGITRVENPRAESTRKSTRVERAKYPVRLRYSRDFRVPGGEDSALESASDVPLLDKMLPTLSKLQNTKVVVAGYTDNVPIWAKLKAGAGLDISGNGAQSHEVTLVQGFAPVTVNGGGNSVAAGVLTGDFLLRLPLDDFWLSVHLALTSSRALVVFSLATVGKDTPSVRPLQ